MFNKQVLALFMLLAFGLAPGAARAAEVEGVKLADSARLESGAALILNGAGLRTRVVFKVYVGALYLQQKRGTAEAVLSDGGAKRMALHLLRDVSSEQLFSALSDGLKNNHTVDQLAKVDAQIKQLEGIFGKVRAVKSGDVFHLDFVPGAGTRVSVNGESRGAIAGDDFYTALLRIWLGDRPAEADLKKALLGG